MVAIAFCPETQVTGDIKDASMRRGTPVKDPSAGLKWPGRGCTLLLIGHQRGGWNPERGAPHMADLAYAVLLIGAFALIAYLLRGLEKL